MNDGNRKRLEATIAASTSRKLREEIRDLRSDLGWDVVDAFRHIDELSDEGELGWEGFRGACRDVLIAVGYYEPMTEDDLRNTVCLGGRKYAFRKGGVPYRVTCGMESWLNDAEELDMELEL